MKITPVSNTHFKEDGVRPLTNGYYHESREDGEDFCRKVTVIIAAKDIGKRSVS
jgi:hypothetical protein